MSKKRIVPKKKKRWTIKEIRMMKASAVAEEIKNLREHIASLKDQLEDLEWELIDHGLNLGVDKFQGDFGTCTIDVHDKKKTAWKKIALSLGATAHKIAANTKKSPVTRIIFSK